MLSGWLAQVFWLYRDVLVWQRDSYLAGDWWLSVFLRGADRRWMVVVDCCVYRYYCLAFLSAMSACHLRAVCPLVQSIILSTFFGLTVTP